MKQVSSQQINRKRNSGLCIMHGCRNKAIVRNGKFGKYCAKCQRRLLKERHPITYWYDLWRGNVKRRNIPFNVTIEEFKIFCDKTNYLELKGKGSGKAVIDRPKSNLGYTLDNMQIMEHSSNSRKVWIDKKLKMMYDANIEPTPDELISFKNDLEAFGNEIKLYEPSEDYDF